METQWPLLSIMVRTGLECSLKNRALGPLKLLEFVEAVLEFLLKTP